MAKKPAAKTEITPKWSASGLKALGPMSSFDYSHTIRNAVIKKIEAYAKAHNIKIIDADVVDNFRG